jgi:membrane protein required for colicin V production
MNWLDLVILCLCIVGLVKGLYDGMIKQVVALCALIIGIYLCSGVASWLNTYLQQLEWFQPKIVVPASYFLGFALIVGIILLAGNVVHRLVSATPLSIINHLCGGLVGLLMMILFISFTLILIEIVDSQSAIIPQEIKTESRFYFAVKNIIPSVLPGNLFELTNEIFI